jgi:type VI secretion system VasD/TssJ family lipoprotein
MHVFATATVLLAAGGCKPKGTCQPDEYEVQVVLHPGKPLNPGDNQESLPTSAHLVQLADDEAIGRFDIEAFRTDPQAALGESYVGHESFDVWPNKDDVRKIRPKEDTRFLLLVAEYRQVLGSGWYLEYEVPRREQHEAAVCTAKARKKPPLPNPCFYALLERYEMRGGASPPAGMKAGEIRIRNKPVLCAPPAHQYDIDPKIAKKQNRKRRLDPSRIPTRLPTAPRTPGAAAGAAPAGAAPAGAPSAPSAGPRRPF